MDEKRTPLVEEETKYKKKSQNKGLPRSKHKHMYETVLLYTYFHNTNIKTAKDEVTELITPTKICPICNRIGDVDESYYYYELVYAPLFNYKEKHLKEEAFNLQKYYREDLFDKFAIKKE